jgi:hypothetical protein
MKIKLSKKDTEKAGELKLDLDIYLEIKKAGLLKKCSPEQKCSFGSTSNALSSLLNKYRIDDLIKIRTNEYKKGKELFIGSLFGFILEKITKNNFVVCIPYKDSEGVDLYIREIDYKKKNIIIHPIQICEFPEKYLKITNKPFEDNLFNFIIDKKFRFVSSNTMLLVWIELENNKRLERDSIIKLIERFKGCKINPYGQIVLIGRAKDAIFNILTLYSKSNDYFVLQYNIENNKIGQMKI